MSLNGYSYVEGNPTNLVDPSGMSGIEIAVGACLVTPGCGEVLIIGAGVAVFGLSLAVATGIVNPNDINLNFFQAGSGPGLSFAQNTVLTFEQQLHVVNRCGNYSSASPMCVASVLAEQGLTVSVNPYGQVAVLGGNPTPQSPYTDEDLIALTDYILSLDDAKKASELCNSGLCGTLSLRQLLANTSLTAIGAQTATQTDDDQDGCPNDSVRITWPTPVWITAGLGDTGATSRNDYPPKVITKVPPVRDNQKINAYLAIQNSSGVSNRSIYNKLGGAGELRIHHKWPLFLDGPDEPYNMVFMRVSEHNAWHSILYRQGKTGWMPRDPNGTVYCVN